MPFIPIWVMRAAGVFALVINLIVGIPLVLSGDHSGWINILLGLFACLYVEHSIRGIQRIRERSRMLSVKSEELSQWFKDAMQAIQEKEYPEWRRKNPPPSW